MSNTTPTVVARILPDPAPEPRANFAARLRRRISTLFVTLLVVFMASMGFTGGTQPAQAGPIDDLKGFMAELFCYGIPGPPSPFTSLTDVAVIGKRYPAAVNEEGWSNRSVTAFEEFGTSGLTWSEYRSKKAADNADGEAGCITNNLGPFIGNQVANQIFTFTRTTTNITIGMYQWATSGDLLDGFSEPLDCIVEGCNGGKGLKQTLFLNYLAPIVMLAALWGAWNGLVKKRTTETAQGGLWMVSATAFALIFMANPSLIAEKTNDFVNEVSTGMTNSVTTATSSAVGKDDMCWLPSGATQRGNRMASCSLYKAMAVTPWAAGQFGVPMGVELVGGTKSVPIGDRQMRDLRIIQIDAQTVSVSEMASGKDYKSIREADHGKWDHVLYHVSGHSPEGKVNGKIQPSFMSWAGEESGQRIQISIASLVASGCLGLLVVLISFSTVVLAIGMILLIMLAPIFLLVGVHPGFGRGIALKWLELLLGTVLKRVVLAAILSILVGMYQVILETPGMSWLAQISLVMALGMGAIIFRKPLLETLNVINLGGSRTGFESSNIERHAKKAGAGAIGGIAGGASAAMAGGGLMGVVGGTFKGSLSGSRSGSPVRAASMGANAGRRAAARRKNDDDDDKPTGGNGGTTDTAARRTQATQQEERKAATLRDQQSPPPSTPQGSTGQTPTTNGDGAPPRPQNPNGGLPTSPYSPTNPNSGGSAESGGVPSPNIPPIPTPASALPQAPASAPPRPNAPPPTIGGGA